MAKTVDTRVVEMRFDNKSFEKGAKETMGTLSRLKEALSFTKSTESIKELQNTANKVDISPMAKSLEMLEKRFSAMGIVGMTVIQNLTNAMINTLGQGISFVNDAIISGGIRRAMNIENAHFQLQALLKDEGKVQAVMDNAMESVDGTAYAYDEAAKAASQFSASGIQAGEDMLGALKGITGVAAMTNSEFEAISMIFTTVAGNGRLMGDQLLQLSSRGLNAASTMSDYFREVKGDAEMTEGVIREMVSDGQISFKDFSDAMTWAFGDSAKRANETFNGAMSNMKSAFARIGAGFVSPLVEQNGELVKLFNAIRVQVNNVKSALVFDEQTSAISGLSKVIQSLNKNDIKSLFSTIKKDGSVSIAVLDEFAAHGEDVTGALTKYINNVSNGTQRATYAVTSAIQDMTGGVEVSSDQVRDFVANGKIDLATFTSAMETEYGDQKALTKQFTDFFLDKVSALVTAIEGADLTKPMEAFYYILEAIKNVLKGMLSIVKPITKAFSDIFLDFSGQDFVDMVTTLEEFTQKLKLSEKSSKNLHDTFEGLFSVAKLVVDIFLKLIGASSQATKPMGSFIDVILSLTGHLGRALTKLTKLISESKLLNTVTSTIGKGFKKLIDIITSLIDKLGDLLSSIFEFRPIKKAVDSIIKLFKKFGDVVGPYLDILSNKLKSLRDWMLGFIPKNFGNSTKSFGDAIKGMADDIKSLNFSEPMKWIQALKDKMAELFEIINNNRSFRTFMRNLSAFKTRIAEAFTFDNLISNIKKIKDTIVNFAEWVGSKLALVFKGFEFGDALGMASGISILMVLFKLAKSIGSLVDKIKAIPDLFSGVKDALDAYQKDLKAATLLKIAEAIGILAGSLVLLSFTDTESLLKAAVAIGIAGGLILAGMGVLHNATDKGNKTTKALIQMAKGFSEAIGDLAKAAKYAALGGLVTAFGVTLLIVVGSIIAIGLLFKKDPDALAMAAKAVAGVGIALVAITGVLALIANMGDSATGVLKIGIGLAAAAIALYILMSSLKKLLKVDLPNDWKDKFAIFSGLIAEVAILAIVIAGSSRLAGEGEVGLKSYIGMAILLSATISALKKLFKIEIPNDWNNRMDILKKVFRSLEELMLVLGVASRISKGAMNAGGTILAVAVFIGSVVTALSILSLLNGEKMEEGAKTLGAVLIALGVSLLGAAKVTDEAAAEAVKAMAEVVTVIVAALGVLTAMDVEALARSATILGGLLIALAYDFKQIGSINDKKKLEAILGMLAAIAEITGALYILSSQPWDSMLAAGTSLSGVLMAMSFSFKILTAVNPDKKAILKFAAACVALLPVVGELMLLSLMPWENLLAAAGALSAVLLSFGTVLTALKIFNVGMDDAIKAAGALDVFVTVVVAGLVALAAAVGALFQEVSGLEDLVKSGIEVLKFIAGGIGEVIGMFIGGIGIGIAAALPPMGKALALFWESIKPFVQDMATIPVTAYANMALLAAGLLALSVAELIAGITSLVAAGGLAVLGGELGTFMVNAMPFFAAISSLDADVFEATKNLAGMILMLTAAEMLQGIGQFFGMTGSLLEFGTELKYFGPHIKEFAETVRGIDPESVKGAAAACEIMANAAKNLPGTDGLVQKIFGEKSLASFGLELTKFGPAIVEFADTVKDINPEAVKGAAAACDIMSTAAGNLPAANGLAQKLFGEHSLADFGEQLEKFGPSIMGFAEEVEDLDPSSVNAAATVTKIMSELANNLPETSSVKSLLLGKPEDIDDFGKQLKKFGKHLAKFAEEVEGIKASGVTGAAKVTDIMCELAHNMPEESSVSSWWSGGKAKDLDDFGKELKKLGPHIRDFAEEVEGVKAGAVQGAATVAKIMTTCVNELPNGSDADDKLGLVEFGEELNEFGPDIRDFARTVGTVHSESVEGAARACMIMAQAAKELPKMKDEENKFKGLSNFGYELSLFAPHIKKFADNVVGLEPTSVEGAARATEIMATCAANLPEVKSKSKFTKLSEFGSELESFGPHISKFATDVKDVVPEAVQGAASAATMMAEVANKLPDTGGLMQKIFGEKNLSDFGAQLVQFGPYIRDFANEVIDVKPEAVQGAADAARIMNEFAQTLGPTGGLASLIKGNTSLTAFGVDLYGFANKFRQFYLAIDDVDILTVNKAINEFGSLVNLAEYVQDNDSKALSKFIEDVAAVGRTGITEFCNSFTHAEKDTSTAINVFFLRARLLAVKQGKILTDNLYSIGETVCGQLQNGIEAKQSRARATAELMAKTVLVAIQLVLRADKFYNLGKDITMGVVNGIGSLQTSLIYKVQDICSAINTTFSRNIVYSNYYNTGNQIVGNISSGISDQRDNVVYMITTMCMNILRTFSGYLTYAEFYELGTNTMRGFVDGINGSARNASSAMALVAGKALEAMQQKLEVHSPSEATYRFGQYVSEGLANGVLSEIHTIESASTNVSDRLLAVMNATAQGVADSIDTNPDFEPTIRPVLDLSNVKSGIHEANTMFNRNLDLLVLYRDAVGAISQPNNQNAEFVVNIDNEQVVNAITGLNDKFDELSATISNMQLTLDSTTVVGGIIDKVDNALGKRSKLRERGV